MERLMIRPTTGTRSRLPRRDVRRWRMSRRTGRSLQLAGACGV